jgi:hypothetical protein
MSVRIVDQWECRCGAVCRVIQTEAPERDSSLLDLLCSRCDARAPHATALRITPQHVRWEIRASVGRLKPGDRARVMVPPLSGQLAYGQVVRVVESRGLEDGEVMVAPGDGPGVSGGGRIYEDQLERIEPNR